MCKTKSKLIFILSVLLFNCVGEILETRNLSIAISSKLFPEIKLSEFIEKYKKDHPNITVVLNKFNPEDLSRLIDEWSTAENNPDLCIGGDLISLSEAVQKDALEPLDDLLIGKLNEKNFLTSFLKDVYFISSDDKKGYFPMLPFMGEAYMLAVNTDIFKKAGLWQEGRPVAPNSFKENDILDFFNILSPYAPDGVLLINWRKGEAFYNYLAPILALHGSIINSKANGFDFSEETAQYWLTLLKKLYDNKLLVLFTEQEKLFEVWSKNKVACCFNLQTRMIEAIDRLGRRKNLSLGFSIWPGSEINGSLIRTRSVWIPRTSKNKDLAKQFISEIIFDQIFQQTLFNKYGWLPALRSAYTEGLERFREYSPLFLAIADNSKSVPLWKDLDKYILIVEEHLENYLLGKETLEKALKSIEEKALKLDFKDLRSVYNKEE